MISRQSSPQNVSPSSRSELSVFLRFLRERVDRDVRALGSHARLPTRVGKRVTQDELSEAIGISREWYALIECGAARTRASTHLLDRLADALMVTPAERLKLFQLAGQGPLRDESIAVLDAFSHLRSLSRRLWTATSIDDVLSMATEHINDWFDGALLVSSVSRRESAPWHYHAVYEKQGRNDAADVIRNMKTALLASESPDLKDLVRTSALHDALQLHDRLPNPGDAGTPDMWPLAVQREMRKLYARRRVGGFNGRYVRVRARTGLIGGFYIAHELGHSYSASDQAVLGAFAEISSYALS